MTKKCSECDYAICDETGWSNFSLEGTNIHCTLSLNPHGVFDGWYGHDPRDRHAENCQRFSHDDGPTRIDVERCDLRGPENEPASWAKYATEKIPARKLMEILVN